MISNKALQIIRDAFDRQAVWGVTELSHFLQKDRSLIHRYIKELVVLGEVKSLGKGPHTRYTMKNNTGKSTYNSRPPVYFSFSHEEVQLLDKYFFKFAANGEPYEGYKGFILWCRERNISPDKAIINFCKLANYIESQRNKCGLLDVSNDFRQHIEGSAIDKLFFADQYNWMEFGRGKLAELTFYAKDNQSIKLITQSINAIIHQLECLIRTSQVDAIAFTPHSRKRSVQLLKELQKKLNTQGLPPIQLVKYAPYGTIIAQKSLKTREQRIQNARQTILINDPRSIKRYKKVLLIDDFVGSGATLNETAKKFKAAGIKQVIGFAWVGNANLSYEVINEI